MTNELPKTLNQIAWGLEHGAFDDDWHGLHVDLWLSGIQDQHLAEEISRRVQSYRIKAALGQIIPFRRPRLSKGRLMLGRDIQGSPIFIPLEYLKAHPVEATQGL